MAYKHFQKFYSTLNSKHYNNKVLNSDFPSPVIHSICFEITSYFKIQNKTKKRLNETLERLVDKIFKIENKLQLKYQFSPRDRRGCTEQTVENMLTSQF